VTGVPIAVRRHASLDAVSDADWEALAARCPSASVFQGPGWNRAWWETRGTGDLHLLAAEREGRLVGLAPLFLAPADSPIGGRTLRFVGAGNSDYLDVLAEGDDPAVVEALLSAATSIPRWARFAMDEMPARAALRRHVEAAGRAGRAVVAGAVTPCPGVRPADGAAGFEAIARKKDLRRKTRTLAEIGALETRHLRTAAEIAPLLPELFRLHVERWSKTPHPSLFLDPNARAFYERLVLRLAPKGGLVFSVLTAGGRVAACHLGLVDGRRFLFYKPAFDVALSAASPGLVLLAELFLLAAREGYEEFDFTRGDEEYKRRYADHVDVNRSYVWTRRPLRDRLSASIRGFARRLRAGASRREPRRRPEEPPADPPTPSPNA
jgi:CelD/BcsL family acetyltransferase involved in cellulose biosynthesis